MHDHDQPALTEAPPERVGLLLADARTRRGLRLGEVTERLGGSLEPAELMALESGAFTPAADTFAELSRLYGVSPQDLVPPRDHLVVDRAEGYMRAGQDIALLENGVGRHDLLSRYLEMIWELRAVEPGTEVPLRDADLLILGESLESDAVTIGRDLTALMGVAGTESAGTVRERATGAPKRRVLIGLGAAIAVVTGAVLLGQSGGAAAGGAGTDGAILPPNPTVTIGEAVVLERGGTQGPVAEAQPVAPTVEIGDAAVLERNPDGSPGTQQTR
jgi:transcriptional regulator with XRE-family HTH domain